MQDLFMYFYQDNCDLNDGNYWWNIIRDRNHYRTRVENVNVYKLGISQTED